MKKLLILTTLLTLTTLRAANPNDLEFLEAFAWGDREAALKELVPDTEDYFYYHCLHHQLANDRVAFHDMLRKWLAHNKNRWNERMKQMRRRQMLIEYPRNPQQTWRFIRDDWNLHFNHRKRGEQRNPDYPSVLRSEQYALEVFIREAKRHNGILDDLTPRGLQYALAENLKPEERRSLLGRLQRPDVPGLVDLILADLDFKDSRGFGHHPIHSLLTRAQLEELGRRKPELLRDQRYVVQRLSRIQPPEADLSHDHDAAVRYYQEMWEFVKTLGSMHNSLKASTLYSLLDHQRKLGTYNETLFRDYLALPRRVHYIPRELRDQWRRQRADWVNFSYRPGRNIALPPIGGEEPLVRDFLIHLLRDDADTTAYDDFFETDWLNAMYAESKILNGIGQPEDWANLLSPSAYRFILDRIELNFAPENPAYIDPGQDVNLQVDVKRVDSLLVKVYEMQTFNYYTTHQAPVDQAVDLDGMIPTHERTLDVSADPGRRVRRTLEFPEIKDRGVYVVELIGNGVSSRALLHVGYLESISQPTAAGQVMMVLNDAGETVTDAAVWLAGREFTANEKGLVLLPFSETPGVRFAVLRSGDFSSPEQIRHLGETYSFSAGIHIDRQTLDRRGTGRLILRPDLRIHGIPLDPGLLTDVTVTLASTDAKDTRSEREYSAEFEKHTEWSREFYVPDGLRRLEVSVSARIKRETDLEETTLTDQASLQVNSGRARDQLKQVFLVPSAAGWGLEVRGLNGGLIADEPLTVYLHHPGFKRHVDLRVTTDGNGRVDLGPLTGLERIRVSGNDLELDEALSGGASTYPGSLHLQPGEAVSLPYPYDREADLKSASLFRKGRGMILEDLGDRVAIGDGRLTVPGLPEGEYGLVLHEAGTTVSLKVLDGESRAGYILGKTERLQETGNAFPSVAGVVRGDGQVTVRLRNATSSTRVAVRAYRYAGPGGAFPTSLGYPVPVSRTVYPPHAQYISGREIGDEYRYVLERKYAKIFAGTLLERPGLILNPWELRETSAEQEELKQDQAYQKGRQRMNAPAEKKVRAQVEGGFKQVSGEDLDRLGLAFGNRSDAGGQTTGSDIGFDFLPEGSVWWVNLRPGEDGTVSAPLEGLDEHTALEVVVVDRFGTLLTRHTLSDDGFEPDEVRLTAGLDPERNFSRQKTVRRIGPDEPVVFPDLATTRYQVVGDLGQAFDILQTLNGEAELGKFSFIKDWSAMEREAKLEKYNQYASHELHLFLHQRDREFFDEVARPYLANKKNKTFVDRWLLEELLPEDTRLDRLRDRNALELALLARRGGNAEAIRAALRETWELLPPDPEGFARRVRVALRAGELDEERSLARDQARREAEAVSRQVMGTSQGAMSARAGRVDASADHFGAPADPAPSAAPVSFAMEEPLAAADEAGEVDGLVLMDMEVQELETMAEDTRLYRSLPKTKELAEQNYWKVRAREDLPGRLTVNEFWRDVAAGEEVSPHLLQSHRNLTDVIAALALCGLPSGAEKPEEKPEGAKLTLSVSSPALLVSEQILPAERSEDDRPLLLSQQFFNPNDMYRYEDNEKIEKFISGEFIRRTVYGARVTLTNPTASRRRLNVLLQIPLGAIPLRNGFYTDDQSVVLEPYTTRKVEYYFTFPESGTYRQFPAHAAAREAIIGQAEPRTFEVKDAPTEVDETSWAWVSQNASDEETLAFLREHNLRRLELDGMAWRLKDRGFYEQAVNLLENRTLFHGTTYSYGIFHEEPAVARVWLANSGVARQVGPVLESELLTVDPVETKAYEHLEYAPLVNPRAHDVGEKRKILNLALREQYRSFLAVNLYRDELDAHERLALVYYLQVQDRLVEAMEQLARVEEAEVHEDLQTDYLKAWLALRNLETDRAMALAEPHVEHPVPRWRDRFAALAGAIREARGAEAAEVEDPSRQQDLDRQAARQPSIELTVESGKILATAHNLETVTMNLYPMDIELLFSRKPFLAEGGADFAVIKPALSRRIQVKGGGEEEEIALPPEYRGRNLMVELTGKGRRASVAWYANRLKVRKMENYGQVEVRSEEENRPLPKTYVKVFAKAVDGTVSFWKDGYTDLRGRFDYVSLNDREPEEAAEFSILILHPELGAEIKEAAPPTR